MSDRSTKPKVKALSDLNIEKAPATEETLQAVANGGTYSYVQSAEDATYKYYGYASSTGWKLKRKTLSTGVWKVAVGTGDYETAWSDRANKTYIYA